LQLDVFLGTTFTISAEQPVAGCKQEICTLVLSRAVALIRGLISNREHGGDPMDALTGKWRQINPNLA
jgi:hypothetical protein